MRRGGPNKEKTRLKAGGQRNKNQKVATAPSDSTKNAAPNIIIMSVSPIFIG